MLVSTEGEALKWFREVLAGTPEFGVFASLVINRANLGNRLATLSPEGIPAGTDVTGWPNPMACLTLAHEGKGLYFCFGFYIGGSKGNRFCSQTEVSFQEWMTLDAGQEYTVAKKSHEYLFGTKLQDPKKRMTVLSFREKLVPFRDDVLGINLIETSRHITERFLEIGPGHVTVQMCTYPGGVNGFYVCE